ncbi:MAG: DMP19 family protein [Patescibacteria group bacterium]
MKLSTILKIIVPIATVVGTLGLIFYQVISPGNTPLFAMVAIAGISAIAGWLWEQKEEHDQREQSYKKDIVAQAVDALEEKRDTNGGIDAMTKREQTIVLCYWFYLEVYNGGIAQFYTNATGFYTYETVSALKTAGLDHEAQILNEFLTLIGLDKTKVQEQELRKEGVAQHSEEVKAFYENQSEKRVRAKTLYDKLEAYVKKG